MDLDQFKPYDALEAAIYLARYSVVRPLCRGRRVLDFACGEGYGSSFMLRWGASDVTGVDASEEAIDRARTLFGESLTFTRADAHEVDDLFQGQTFDLIVSLDSIENVADPEGHLDAIRRLAAPGSMIVVSCPNDTWYYGGNKAHNPYHLRRYSFDEFKSLAEGALGPAAHWALGGPMAGFGTVSLESPREAPGTGGQASMLGAIDSAAALMVPADPGRGLTSLNAAAFVGSWGAGTVDLMPTMAVIPLGMDVFEGARVSAARRLAAAVFSQWITEPTLPIERRLARLEGENLSLQDEVWAERKAREELELAGVRLAEDRDELETQRRHALLRSEADRAELALAIEGADELRAENDRLQAKIDEMALPYARYRRLRALVPPILRRAFRATYGMFISSG